MKKIIISLVAILIFKIGFSQNGSPLYPITQNLGSSSSLVDVKGGQRINGAFVLGHFVDTAAANAIPYVKNFANGLITTDTSLVWLRSYDAKKWLLMPTQGRIVNGDSINYLVDVNRPPGQLNVYGKFFNGISAYSRLLYTDSIGSGGGSSYTFPYSVVAPGNAIQLENDTTANPANYFYGRNSAGRRGWYPQSGIVGVTPTLQQVLTAGSTLTGTNGIVSNGDFSIRNNSSSNTIYTSISGNLSSFVQQSGRFYFETNSSASNTSNSILAGTAIPQSMYGIDIKGGGTLIGSSGSTSSNTAVNYILLDSNRIVLHGDTLKITKGVPYTLSTTGKKIMIRDTATGLVQNIDPALIGGGISNIYTDDNALTTNIDTVRTNKGFNAITYSTTPAWDMRTGFDKSLTLTGDADLSITHSQDGDVGIILFIQDGSGGHNVTVPNADFEITQTAGDSTIASFVFDGVKYHWAVLGSSGGGTVTRIGALDSLTKSANGIQIAGDAIVPQTADATYPGFISLQDQVIGNGVKTFSRYIISDTLYGGTGSAGNLFMSTTTHATKGTLSIGAEFRYDQANNELRLGTTDFGNYSLQVPAYAAVGYGAGVGRIDIANSNNTTGSSKLKLIRNNGTGIGELTGFNPSATGTWGGVAYAGSTEILAYGKLMLSSVGAAYIITNNTLPSAIFNTSGNIDFGNKFTKYNNTAPTNGQLLIGGTSAGNFTAATITAGAGISVTNGNNSITIASSDVESTYTPTLFNTTNIAASTAYTTYYQRIGDVVRVWGTVDIDATTLLTISEMGMSLPVSSGLVNVYDVAGTAAFEDNTSVQIKADVSNTRAVWRFTPQTATNNKYSFHFTYKYVAP